MIGVGSIKVLAIESSAKTASAAIVSEDKIISEAFVNSNLTHSQTLLPMVEAVFNNSAVDIREVDGLAVAYGPGSFTGVRIGVSMIKGMAFASKLPCVPVSTLKALAYNLIDEKDYISAVMDARCNQVYNCIYQSTDSGLIQLTEERAIPISRLETEFAGLEGRIFLVGDGSSLCYDSFGNKYDNIRIAPESLRFGRAASVGKLGIQMLKKGEYITGEQLAPLYLRPSRAERMNKENK